MGFVQGECRFRCVVTGKEVTTHKQRNEIMKRNNLVDANDFPPEAAHAKAKKIWDDNAALAAQLPQPEVCKSVVPELY